MSDTADARDISAVVDELLMLIHETAEYQQQKAVRAVLCEARQVVVNIRRRLQSAANRYVVAVVGLTNVGKSTLLNALLGDDLAPRRNGPCTAVPIEFTYGAETRLTVFHFQSLHRPSWLCPRTELLHQHLQKLADDQGAEASRSIRCPFRERHGGRISVSTAQGAFGG